ncbi:MAG: PilW family protein [Thermoanaerobaculales bacterium]|nr:PilW family protein [Thermoanaerobaculales bacterium]
MIPSIRREAGFSLVEILLALGLTALLMMVASQLTVSMKRSSDRMRISAETKLRAQKALDFLAMNVRGATDMNPIGSNPAAIMTWYERGVNPVQATFNNVTNANLADVGTDIITIAKADSNTQVANIKWPGSVQNAANAWWEFGPLCPDGAANLALFKELTQESGGLSQPILLVDSAGHYAWYQITNYLDAWNTNQGCNQTPPEIHVVANPGNSDMLNPPGGPQGLVNNLPDEPIRMMLGVKFFTFRVRNGWLEQKMGLFNPATDNPGTAFTPLIQDVEDLQFAWPFTDGTIWNTATQQLPSGTYTNSVPAQGTALAYDVLNVNALRITVVARSTEELTWDPAALFSRPAIEDRTGGANDRFFHHRATTLVMIRNRNLIF